MIKTLAAAPGKKDLLLNVNVPDLPYEQIEGFIVTRLGQRHKSEPAIPALDPHGRPVYWVGMVGPEQNAGTDTDFYAVRNNKVSITPLHVDLTRYSVVQELMLWAEGITKDES